MRHVTQDDYNDIAFKLNSRLEKHWASKHGRDLLSRLIGVALVVWTQAPTATRKHWLRLLRKWRAD